MQRLGAAAQHHGVAALQAEPGGIGGDVGAGFEDDADHPEGNAHPADLDAVGAPPHAGHLADRVGEQRDLAQAIGHRPDAPLVEGQAIDHRRRQAALAGRGQVKLVGRLQLLAALLQGRRHVLQQLVLDAAGEGRHHPGGLFRLPRQGQHLVAHAHRKLLESRCRVQGSR